MPHLTTTNAAAAASVSNDVHNITLSYWDSWEGINTSALTAVFVLDLNENEIVEDARIKRAAEGVARKWRLYAGRISLDKQLDRLVIKAPLGDLPPNYKLINFTSITKDSSFPTPLPPTVSNSCTFVPMPDAEPLRAPSTKATAAELGPNDPLVSIHVVHYTNSQQISFTIPHSIVDATAFAVYLRAFSDELNAVEWEAPPLESSSVPEQTVALILGETNLTKEDITEIATGKGGPLEGLEPHWTRPFSLLGTMAYEKMWHGTENGSVFLGRDVVEWLAGKVKSEVREQSGGEEWVSTGDVLLAWLLKAAYADERSHTPIRMTNAICPRKTLELDGRPQCLITVYWNLALPSPHSATLASLALSNRRRIEASRDPIKTAATFEYLKTQDSRQIPLWLTVGPGSWLISDQRQAGAAQSVDWGQGRGKKQAYWLRNNSEVKDNTLFLNELEEGYLWAGVMRRSRWESVRSAAGELERDFEKAQAEDVDCT